MSYAIAGWVIALVVLAAYAGYLLARERRLAETVPPASRRWLTSPDRTDG